MLEDQKTLRYFVLVRGLLAEHCKPHEVPPSTVADEVLKELAQELNVRASNILLWKVSFP